MIDESRPGTISWKSVFDYLTSLIVIAMACILVWSRLSTEQRTAESPSQLPSEAVSLNDSPLKGSEAAPVALVLFTDFECAFCKQLARDVLPEIDRAYIEKGLVLLSVRHMALPIHKNAGLAGAAAECARRQSQFWPMYDGLLAKGAVISEAYIRYQVATLRLDKGAFESCLAAEGARKIESDRALAARLGVKGTPTLLLGRQTTRGSVQVLQVVPGIVPVAVLKAKIDEILRASDYSHTDTRPVWAWPIGVLVIAALVAVTWRHRRRRHVSGGSAALQDQ